MSKKQQHRDRRPSRPLPALFTWTNPGRVREEIAAIEARLSQIGHDGDCAYEKAMVRFFEEQMALRRAWLARQSSSHPMEGTVSSDRS